MDVDDNFLTNFMSHVDSRLDGLEGTGDSSVVLFGAAAVVMAYSQREVGAANYKMELRRKIESGEFDVDEVSLFLYSFLLWEDLLIDEDVCLLHLHIYYIIVCKRSGSCRRNKCGVY